MWCATPEPLTCYPRRGPTGTWPGRLTRTMVRSLAAPGGIDLRVAEGRPRGSLRDAPKMKIAFRNLFAVRRLERPAIRAMRALDRN